jgi:enoyl-CoA hydratase/carnithine racemase
MKTVNRIAVLLAATVLTCGVAHAQTPNSPPAAVRLAPATINVETVSPEIRVVKFANPPVNLITPETLSSLNRVVKDLGKDEAVKVVIFTSGVDGYFFNHFDMNAFPNFLSQTGDNAKPLWVELITNLSNAPFITIASIHGRTQGGGDELALAFDLRYASREKAVFGQPEVGIGLFPGGGGPDHLAKLAGRDRALEVFLTADDYDAETAEQFGWVTRTLPDAELDGFVSRLARRLATFDKTALVTTKRHINAAAAPNEAELLRSYSQFTKSLSWPGLQQRMPVFGQIIQKVGPEKVESNLGYYVGEGNRQLHEQKK